MVTQFFNFGNQATFHFFKWITEGGVVDPDALIAKAFDAAGDDPWLIMGECVSRVVCDQLAGILEELLDEQKADFNFELEDYQAIGDIVKENPKQSLFYPILNEALSAIRYHAVAEAILIRAKKWSPETQLPPLE